MDDETLTDSIASDPFHQGLAKHGKFEGFAEDKRRDSARPVQAMTDEEIEDSRSMLARLVRNPQLLLVLTYLGILCLMGKAYA